MSTSHHSLALIAVLMGCGMPLQAGINASMARFLGHPLLGAVTNTAVATLALAALLVVLPVTMPRLRLLADAPWWSWTGGLFGATFVVGALFLAPRMGASVYVSATIVGTMTASLLLDHFGLLAFEPAPMNLWKLAGAAMVVGGMMMIQFNR